MSDEFSLPVDNAKRTDEQLHAVVDRGEAAIVAGNGSAAMRHYLEATGPRTFLRPREYARTYSKATRQRVANAIYTVNMPAGILLAQSQVNGATRRIQRARATGNTRSEARATRDLDMWTRERDDKQAGLDKYLADGSPDRPI